MKTKTQRLKDVRAARDQRLQYGNPQSRPIADVKDNPFYVYGYSGSPNVLRGWLGATILEGRGEIVKTYHDEFGEESYAVAIRLTRGRFVVGYSLGEGMLFRGELLPNHPRRHHEWYEVCRQARSEAEYWFQIDADDRERDQFEQERQREEVEAEQDRQQEIDEMADSNSEFCGF